MINKERGEVGITLGQTVRPMRPTWEAIVAIENELNTTISFLVARSLTIEWLKVEEAAAIVAQGILAAGKDRKDQMLMSYQKEKIAQQLYEDGIVTSREPINMFLANALNGGKPANEEPKKKEEEDQASLAIAG